MVEFYNGRLTERERRRDFLRARDLLNMRRMQASATSRRQTRDGCPQHSGCDLRLATRGDKQYHCPLSADALLLAGRREKADPAGQGVPCAAAAAGQVPATAAA